MAKLSKTNKTFDIHFDIKNLSRNFINHKVEKLSTYAIHMKIIGPQSVWSSCKDWRGIC